MKIFLSSIIFKVQCQFLSPLIRIVRDPVLGRPLAFIFFNASAEFVDAFLIMLMEMLANVFVKLLMCICAVSRPKQHRVTGSRRRSSPAPSAALSDPPG